MSLQPAQGPFGALDAGSCSQVLVEVEPDGKVGEPVGKAGGEVHAEPAHESHELWRTRFTFQTLSAGLERRWDVGEFVGGPVRRCSGGPAPCAAVSGPVDVRWTETRRTGPASSLFETVLVMGPPVLRV